MVTRFAPAPTGHLHLGHVVNAIYVWGIARALGGRVLLRIEDHDRQRSRTEYEAAILDDLDWLGFVPDAPRTDEFRAGVCDGRQRDRQSIYARALEQLREQGLIYVCQCSRREIAALAAGGEELRYSGTCATKSLADAPGRALRLRLAPSVERFVDGLHGTVEQRPWQQCGDFVLRDRDGNWTYQFAVVADDVAQQVTHVIRGDDLLSSTGRQIQLARLLDRVVPPTFVHHPLVMKSSTQKLSKADRDTSIQDLRRAGLSAAAIIGRAAHAAGLLPDERALEAADAQALPVLMALACRLPTP